MVKRPFPSSPMAVFDLAEHNYFLFCWLGGFLGCGILTLFTQKEEEILRNSPLLVSDGQSLLCVRNSSWGGLAASLTFIPCCNFVNCCPFSVWSNRAFLIPLFELGNGGLKGFCAFCRKVSNQFHFLGGLGYNVRSKSKSELVLKEQRWTRWGVQGLGCGRAWEFINGQNVTTIRSVYHHKQRRERDKGN